MSRAAAAPSLIRTRSPKTSPAAVPAIPAGTGSPTGRTRNAPLPSTARTAAASAATHAPSASSKAKGRSATSRA
ncbi:hypothetical protein ABZW02_29860 [Streptomyces sp. NPDC005180]|uniref:hypothetical protein n=1 Tax=Streptomyces sp. NPDC005180 TaxID=3156868 RepID=UPI0033AAE515